MRLALPRPSRFTTRLALIALAGLVIRIAYVWFVKRHDALAGDEYYYYLGGVLLAGGFGFLQPGLAIAPPYLHVPGADHPPVTQIFTGAVSYVVPDSILADRLAMAVVGAVTVFVIGLVGRKIAGDRAGLIAAGLAAVYAALWLNDGAIMSEALGALFVAVAILFAYRLASTRSRWDAIWLGLAIGLGTLTRAESILMLPFVVLPLTWIMSRGKPVVQRLFPFGVATLVAVAVIAPWSIYNQTRFEHPVPISTNVDLALVGVNCDDSYSGNGLGLWSVGCSDDRPKSTDASVVAQYFRHKAFRYVGDHLGRLPVVVAAREGRVWGLYRPFAMADYMEPEGRPRWGSNLALAQYYVLAGLAIAGWVALRRRRVLTVPLVAQGVIVAVTVAVFGGVARYRLSADVAIVLLAAVTIDALLSRTWPRRGAPSPSDEGGRPVEDDAGGRAANSPDELPPASDGLREGTVDSERHQRGALRSGP